MQTSLHRGIISLWILLLAPLFLTSCSEDTVGPDSYPVVFKPKSIKSISEIKTFVNEGGAWKEISTDNPDIASDPFFAESTVIDDDSPIRLLSETEFQFDEDPDKAKFSYTRDGDEFVFSALGITIYAQGNYSTFNAYYAAVLPASIGIGIRLPYDPAKDIFTQFELDPNSSTNDTVAYQTFQMVYEAE